jgi:hypothetical protein
MNSILEGVESQKSTVAVVDSELYDLEAPNNRLQELKGRTERVQNVVVAGKS